MGIEDYAETQARLAAAADRLEREFVGVCDRSTVERMLAASAEEFSGRGVESFVATLAERFTRERLARRLRAPACSTRTRSKCSSSA